MHYALLINNVLLHFFSILVHCGLPIIIIVDFRIVTYNELFNFRVLWTDWGRSPFSKIGNFFSPLWLLSLRKVFGSKIGAMCFSITVVVIDVGIISKSIFSEMYAPLAT